MTSAEQVVAAYLRRNWMIAAAESCTGGMLAAAITDVAGASAVFDRGFVTYSNAAKVGMISVPAQLIASYGAVSKEVALAMAEGALAASRAEVSIAITGIAGPSGGTSEKPVGLVHFAVMRQNSGARHLERRFKEQGRAAIRQAAVLQALLLLAEEAA